MAWQLANEPRPGADTKPGHNVLPPFYRWIDETAAFIRSLDACRPRPRHGLTAFPPASKNSKSLRQKSYVPAVLNAMCSSALVSKLPDIALDGSKLVRGATTLPAEVMLSRVGEPGPAIRAKPGTGVEQALGSPGQARLV